jgi:hypothetical protein
MKTECVSCESDADTMSEYYLDEFQHSKGNVSRKCHKLRLVSLFN